MNCCMKDEPTKRTMQVSSDPEAVEQPRQWLLAQLKDYQYCDDDVFAVHLAFQEAFYNAIRHGSKMNPGKKVQIDCLVGPDRIEISMADAGKGFDPDAVPDCRLGENLYKPEGRGLLLMRSYMDVVQFNDVGNAVHMVRYRHDAKDPAASVQRS